MGRVMFVMRNSGWVDLMKEVSAALRSFFPGNLQTSS